MPKIHRLRNRFDKDPHNSIEVVDDGPFPGDGDETGSRPFAYRSVPPSQGRQVLLALLKARGVRDTLTGIVVSDPNGGPVWEPITDVSDVFDPSAGANLNLPVAAPVSLAEEAAPVPLAAPPTAPRARVTRSNGGAP